MEPDFRPLDALRFVERAGRARIARYREQAADFRKLAQSEPLGRLRNELLKLAQRYDALAEDVTTKRRRTG